MDDIVVKPDTTLREYQECVKLWRRANFRGARVALWTLVVVCAGALSFSVVGTWGSLASVASAVALMSLAIYWAVSGRIYAAFERMSYQRFLDGSTVYIITPDGIRWTANYGRGELSWNYFNKIIDTTQFYIFLRGNALMCIPKRSIPPDRLQDFIALLPRAASI